MRLLVVNAGSSTLKVRLLSGTSSDSKADSAFDLVADEQVEGRWDRGGVQGILERLLPVDGVAHRVVHGGDRFIGPVLIDDDVEQELEGLVRLAPLHQPPALAAVRVVRELLPDTPMVACFDTAFHATIPEAARTYALPAAWRSAGIRRYGFHGLSHAYAARRAAQMLAMPVDGFRIVTCHLGAGASLAAVQGGQSVDTTMGFTPLEGLVMATRSGSVDPGALLWLETAAGLTPEQVEDGLEHRSGVLGLAGSADLREVLARVRQGDHDANLALDVYVHRLRAGIASMAAAMDGIDVLVFTGGVGEHAAEIRARTAAGLGFLGIRLHPRDNESRDPDTEIGEQGAPVRTLVIHAREDLEMARLAAPIIAGLHNPVR